MLVLVAHPSLLVQGLSQINACCSSNWCLHRW